VPGNRKKGGWEGSPEIGKREGVSVGLARRSALPVKTNLSFSNPQANTWFKHVPLYDSMNETFDKCNHDTILATNSFMSSQREQSRSTLERMAMGFVTNCTQFYEQQLNNMERSMMQEQMVVIASLKSTIADLEAEMQRLIVDQNMKHYGLGNAVLHDASQVKKENQQDAAQLSTPSKSEAVELDNDAFAYALVEATRKDSTGIQLEILTRELYANEVSASSLHVKLQERSSHPLCLHIVKT
jgi:hypothetical protein